MKWELCLKIETTEIQGCENKYIYCAGAFVLWRWLIFFLCKYLLRTEQLCTYIPLGRYFNLNIKKNRFKFLSILFFIHLKVYSKTFNYSSACAFYVCVWMYASFGKVFHWFRYNAKKIKIARKIKWNQFKINGMVICKINYVFEQHCQGSFFIE